MSGPPRQSIGQVLHPQVKDLGEFTVRRVLPASERKMVGPFIFFDHMGPAEFPPGKGIAVRPHPHIGIATITYLFEGEIIHRDSLGYVQAIRAGAVNLMAAGRGIVHSERAGADLDTTSRLHGIQSWMALPSNMEEMEPEFLHYGADSIPEIDIEGCTVRVIMGTAFGAASPVRCYSPTLYLECRLPAGSCLALPADCPEMAAYVLNGRILIGRDSIAAGAMAIARSGRTLNISSEQDSRVMVIGGHPVGERHIWWNFVSSSRARIEQAGADWQHGRFAKVPGETEFIPLPG
jgi:redox-sensitive bicupin YhaK (pirin superfamily)